MEHFEISKEEYERMKEELELLKNTELISKMNRLIDLLFQDKYGLYLGNYTEDLTESAINRNYSTGKSVWDEL